MASTALLERWELRVDAMGNSVSQTRLATCPSSHPSLPWGYPGCDRLHYWKTLSMLIPPCGPSSFFKLWAIKRREGKSNYRKVTPWLQKNLFLFHLEHCPASVNGYYKTHVKYVKIKLQLVMILFITTNKICGAVSSNKRKHQFWYVYR